MMERSRKNSHYFSVLNLTKNSKTFTCSSLPIGNNCAIVTFESRVSYLSAAGLIHLLLLSFLAELVVELEDFSSGLVVDADSFLKDFDAIFRLHFYLSLVERSNSESYLYCFLVLGLH